MFLLFDFDLLYCYDLYFAYVLWFVTAFDCLMVATWIWLFRGTSNLPGFAYCLVCYLRLAIFDCL